MVNVVAVAAVESNKDSGCDVSGNDGGGNKGWKIALFDCIGCNDDDDGDDESEFCCCCCDWIMLWSKNNDDDDNDDDDEVPEAEPSRFFENYNQNKKKDKQNQTKKTI